MQPTCTTVTADTNYQRRRSGVHRHCRPPSQTLLERTVARRPRWSFRSARFITVATVAVLSCTAYTYRPTAAHAEQPARAPPPSLPSPRHSCYRSALGPNCRSWSPHHIHGLLMHAFPCTPAPRTCAVSPLYVVTGADWSHSPVQVQPQMLHS